MVKQVFLSHSSLDKDRFVDDFVKKLRRRNISVWYDSDELLPGDRMIEHIFEHGLDRSDVVVVVLSHHSLGSSWVRHEIATAIQRHHKGRCGILPVVLDGVDVLSELDSFVYERIPDLSDYCEELDRIAAGIRRHITDPAAGPELALFSEPAPTPTASHRLPMPPQRFVNRKEEIDELDAILEQAEDTPGSAVAVVHGMPGVGKSSLATLWANAIRDKFSDGSHHVDFGSRGRDDPPDIDDIMVQLLGELGAEESAISTDRASRQQAYNRLTDSKQMLVFADNVTEYAQIRQIRPRGDGSLVIAAVSTYSKEFDLEDAEPVELLTLGRLDAVAMIRKLSGFRRRDDPDTALSELAEHCGDLPIALAVAASHLRRHRSWSVSEFLERIAAADDHLEAIAGGHGRMLTRMFDEVYNGLGADLRQFYRRLSLFPGTSFTEDAAAVVTDISATEARDRIEKLRDAHLVTEELQDRYQIHALVAEHMRQTFTAHERRETAGLLAAALVEWYRRAVMDADVAVSKQRLRLAPRTAAAATRVDVPVFASSAEAQRWYVSERHNLLAVMELSMTYGLYEPVWHMAEAMWLLYTLSNYYSDWEQSARLGIDAAVECGNPQAEARLRPLLARVLALSGRYPESASELSQARQVADGTDNLALRAMVTEFEGTCAHLEGNKDRAEEALLSARAQMQQLNNDRGVAVTDLQLSVHYLKSDDYASALEASRRARSAFEHVNDPMNVAKVVLMAARALLGLGRLPDTLAEATAAIESCQQQGMKYHTAGAHEAAAKALTGLGRRVEAKPHWQAAYRWYSEIGHDKAEQLEELLIRNGNEDG